MKFKYQLRGFAVGVIITVVIMTAIQRDNQSDHISTIPNDGATETEEELEHSTEQDDSAVNIGNKLIDYQNDKENAQQLEIESDLLVNNTVENDVEKDEITENELVENETVENEPIEEEELFDSLMVGEENVLELDLKVDESQIANNKQEVTLSIVSGDSSYSVSKKLFDLGVVDDALAFDLYLCANGYDKRIRVGKYTIEPSVSYEQLSKLISSQ